MERKIERLESGLYKVDGKEMRLDCVTSIIAKTFPKFNAEEVIENMKKSEGWNPTHKYWGMTSEQIQKQWSQTGEQSRDDGNKLHKEIERVLVEGLTFEKCKKRCEASKFSDPAYIEFKKYVSDNPGMTVYKIEWKVFDIPSKVYGIPDIVIMNEDGSVDIIDWKRKKEIKKFGKKFYHIIFGEVMDCDLMKGTFQLNMYRVVFERNYALRVRGMRLVRFFPGELYEEIYCKRIPEIDKWFDQRIESS